MEFRTWIVSALIVSALARPAAAQRVVDGDTLEIDGTRWRLWASMRRRCTRPVLTVGQPGLRQRPQCASSSQVGRWSVSSAAMIATSVQWAYAVPAVRI
jgi:hypothetical protein